MNELTLSGSDLCEAAQAADERLCMDEERFRAFYERTSRGLWGYLCHVTGDRHAADDLVQETYYRMLRARLPEMNETQLKSYLFRTASNLVRDEWRKRGAAPPVESQQVETLEAAGPIARTADEVETRRDLAQAMHKLKPRERELLWLAYVEGSSHEEIAQLSGLRANSIRPMLHRARQKLATILRGMGHRG